MSKSLPTVTGTSGQVLTTSGFSNSNLNLNANSITLGSGSSTSITISPNQTVSSGYVYTYGNYDLESVSYEPLHPVAVNHNKTGERLIIWEP